MRFFPVVDERLGEHEIPEIGDSGDRVDEGLVGLSTASCLEQLVHVLERLFHLVFDQLELVPLQILLKNLLGLHQVGLFFQVVKKAHGHPLIQSSCSSIYTPFLPAGVRGV